MLKRAAGAERPDDDVGVDARVAEVALVEGHVVPGDADIRRKRPHVADLDPALRVRRERRRQCSEQQHGDRDEDTASHGFHSVLVGSM